MARRTPDPFLNSVARRLGRAAGTISHLAGKFADTISAKPEDPNDPAPGLGKKKRGGAGKKSSPAAGVKSASKKPAISTPSKAKKTAEKKSRRKPRTGTPKRSQRAVSR